MMRNLPKNLFLAILFIVFPVVLWGQVVTGTVTGSVVDASGAVVVGAEVHLTNTATGLVNKATTDETGFFRFLQLPSGVYSLEAEMQGFKKFRRDGIIVEVNRSLSVPVAFEVGPMAQTVEVKGGTPLLEPNNAVLGTVMDMRKVDELPLSGRNTFGLANLIPTVRGIGYFGGSLLSTWRMGQVTIGGGGPMSNGFLVDGIANEKMTDFSAMAFLTVDATQEFKVETNAMAAEFGRTGGGIISVISRSGTNQFHGTAFDFLRNDHLNANEWFANAGKQPRPALHVNQFGGAIGGPIKRDKLFFFGNYEGFRERRAASRTVTAPTALQRTGDFSQTLNSAGALIRIFDPATTRIDPANPGRYIRTQFPNNVIPTARLSNVARKSLEYYPAPNLPGLPFSQAQNSYQESAVPVDKDTWGVKIDYQLSSTRRLSGRYTDDSLDWGFANYFGNIADVDGRHIFIPRKSAFLQFTDALTPTLLVDAKVGLNRENEHSVAPAAGLDITTLGFPASYASAIQKKGAGVGFPIYNFSLDATTFGRGDSNGNPSSTGSASVAMTKISGKHSLKSGYEMRLYRRSDWGTNFNAGSFTFSRGFTQGPDPLTASNTAGYEMASFLLGTPSSGQVGMTADTAVSVNYHAFYLQDDWKITPKLTLNLGMRWEYEGPAEDRFNTYPNFDPSMASPLQVPGLTLRGGNVWPETNGLPKGLTDRSFNDIGPRFGFAYQLRPKIVVRGGYGIMYIPTFGPSGLVATGAGFAIITPMVTSLDGGLTPANTLDNPFPQGLQQLTGSSAGALTSVGGSAAGQLRNQLRGYTQQWNFTVQCEPWANWLFEAAWVGNHGTRLITGSNLNFLPDQYLSLGTQLLTSVPNPFLGIIKTGTLSTATVTRRQLLLPFPQFTSVSGGNTYWGNSIYHALAFKVEKRFSRGYSVLAAYTASKLIDDVPATGRPGAVATSGVQNWNNLRGERSRSAQDIPQRLVLTGLWEIPYKPANTFLKHTLGGWQVNTIGTIESGRPIGLTATISNGGNRPNSTGTSAKLDDPTISRWFDTTQFTQPAAFTYGNVSRVLPDVNSDGLFNLDFSVFKSFSITERVKLQFRTELFNLTNSPTFDTPGRALGAATFGRVTATTATTALTAKPREIQFALKLSF